MNDPEDIPTLTDLIRPPSGNQAAASQPASTRPPVGVETADSPPGQNFLLFFWEAEQLRQDLLMLFNYRVNRRIERYGTGAAAVKFIFPPYGDGEPGSQMRQSTCSIGTLATVTDFKLMLAEFEDALQYFTQRQQRQQLAEEAMSLLTPSQLKALEWALKSKEKK